MKTTTLAVAVLTLAALPFSGASVEPTCSLQVARSGLVETPLSVNDAGVLEVKQILSGVMSHASPHADIVAEMENALMARYGPHSVAIQVLGPEYYWDYDPSLDIWTFVCTAASQLLVDDGGDSPVVARVSLEVPFEADPR